MQRIELDAGEQFRAIGRPDVADDHPFSLEELSGYVSDGRAWVAADGDGVPVGYAVVDRVDGHAHIEQVSVVPAHQGQGIGRALIDQARTWASSTGLRGVTLTTFTEVPWNAPLYRHLGFRVLADHELGPELRALRDEEAARGLDPTERVCMRLDLGAFGDWGPTEDWSEWRDAPR